MTDTRLKNCPFCGGEPKLFGPDKGYCYVKCPTCFIVTCYYYDVATTIAAWNRRSTPTPDVPEGWRDALEHVTELLVDTWHHQMDGDPEEHIAVKDARALLATLPLSVPEGWVLLPREPTDGMIDKGESALVTGPAETELQDAPSATWAAAKACYRAMLSASPTPPVDDGWRPIETAPKDGTDVLLWDGEEIFVGYWSDSIWVSPGAWVKEEHRSDTATYIPTHWMPLPAAPTEARDE